MSSDSNWFDFNSATDQMTFEVIPRGTFAKVCLCIKPGGYSDPERGWTGGWATKNNSTGTVYLNCEFTVSAGQYARRKVWGLIGLYSNKGEQWGNSGRSFIKAILNSAHGLSCNDKSPEAQRIRQLNDFSQLDGIEFLARIDVEIKPDGSEKNVIKLAITPERSEYAIYMGKVAQAPWD